MKTESFYSDVLNNLCDGIYFVDLNRKITFWNKAAEEITGYYSDEIVGKFCRDNLLNHIDEAGNPLCIVSCPLYHTMIDGIQRRANVFLRHKTGHRLPISVNIFPVKENGEIVGAVEVFTQASSVVYEDRLIETLSEIAMNDELTGLPNRRYLSSFLEYRINEYNRFNIPTTVLFIDIDNFSNVNNKYGHDAGDAVLKNITTSISKSMSNADLFGRWGGEEFLGVFSLKNETEAFFLAEKVRVLIANTETPVNGKPLSVTASVGVTVINGDDNVETIVERADKLMYKSKKTGKNRITADIKIISKKY